MKVSLKNIIVPSIPLAVLSIGFCFALWMSTFLGHSNVGSTQESNFFVGILQSLFVDNILAAYLLSFTFNLLNAFLLAQLNNKFTLIRTRTFLPILIFLLLMGSWDDTHTINGSHISLTLFIFSLFYIFEMNRNPKASEQAFMGSFLLSVASLFVMPFIFLLPVCWIGFLMSQSFSLRTFLASIFGAITPWLLYLGTAYLLYSQLDLSSLLSMNFVVGIDFSTFSLVPIIYFSVLAAVMIICLIGLYGNAHTDSMHTRLNLNFLVLILLSMLVIVFIFNQQFAAFLPIIALVYALLVSHSFTLKQNDFYSYVFIVFFVVNVLYAISKLVV